MVAGCEIDSLCRMVIRLCHSGDARPQLMFKDITRRQPEQLPAHDLYVAGFPCQPFSTMGLGQGVQDKQGRGVIIEHILTALEVKRPRAFLLENVKGINSQRHRPVLGGILQRLRCIGNSSYKVGYRVLDTADFGLPQHRERLYIVGVLRSCLAPGTSFRWPTPTACASLGTVLRWGPIDRRKARNREKKFLSKASPRLKRRLVTSLKRIKKKGLDPRDPQRPVVIDVDGSAAHFMVGISPCLTRARASTGHYLPALGRRMTIQERLRLQGLPTSIWRRCCNHISERQLGAMVGNSLSLNVIRALLSSLLPACGLLDL